MKRSMKRSLMVVAIFLTLICIASTDCRAADKYPSRPVELVIGMAAGGQTDIFNRIMAKYFEKYLKQPFVPINKPGPSQMMAASYVANAKPDGYTVGHMSNAIVTADLTGLVSGYSLNDMRAVCQISSAGLVIAVTADSPWKTYQDFVEYAKKNQGVQYGHNGIGSGPHYRMEGLNKYAKLNLTGIPFKGEAESLPMLLGKHVPLVVLSPLTAKAQAAAGKVKILFAFDPPLQDGFDASLPSLESVYGKNAPDLDTLVYLWVHKKTPEDIVQNIEQAFVKMSRDPEFLSEIKKNNLLLNYVDGNTVVKTMAQKSDQYKEALGYLGLLKK